MLRTNLVLANPTYSLIISPRLCRACATLSTTSAASIPTVLPTAKSATIETVSLIAIRVSP